MKLVKMLTLSAVLFLAPIAASAGLIGSLLDPILDPSGPAPAVPEPSGALVMGVALGTVALATRRKRK
jgi:hypothetical protein